MATAQQEGLLCRKLSLLRLAQELGNVSKACCSCGWRTSHTGRRTCTVPSPTVISSASTGPCSMSICASWGARRGMRPSRRGSKQDLDIYPATSNRKRPHRGRGMEGRTPYQIFKAGRKKAKEAAMARPEPQEDQQAA